ncbi:MAG TPA: GGDEF domain-containing protein [Gammaproteobacteria bacterium]|nr:GGDEF domain-containing protein [Gammaproteobacteria bacterium]
MNINWLTMHFPEPALEQEFQRYYEQRFGWMMRLAIAVAILFYGLFGILDGVLYPDFAERLWFIRFVVVIPVLLAIAIYLFRQGPRRWSQLLVSLGSLVGGLGIIAMTIIIPPEHTDIYFAGLMLVAMFSYTVFRLQFVWASTVGWVTVLIYNFVTVLYADPAPGELLTANFFYISANLMGMVACYEMEYDARQNFTLQRELETEQKRLDQLVLQLDEMAHRDELTGLANRRYFFEHFQQEWNRHLRFAAPISLLLIDVDYFKNYNDTYGHQAGDECLRKVAATLSDTARRAGDFVARIGGEEFVALLARTEAEDACLLGEKLRWQIEQAAVSHSASRVADVVTISVGAATIIPDKERRLEDLLRCADEALYAAKANGRNQVICRRLSEESASGTEDTTPENRSDISAG